MKQTTLCFLLKDDQVLLAMKKRGFGIGKWNGVGGKVKDGESVRTAMVREIKEEIGVNVKEEDMQDAGTIEFQFKDNPDWSQRCFVFIASVWNGEPSESEEMRPQWYLKNDLPFREMWVDDPHWLPIVLQGKKIEAKFLFNEDGSAIMDSFIKIDEK